AEHRTHLASRRPCARARRAHDVEATMVEVLLFPHAHGLTPGVTGFADELRAAGHRVHTPDLFDGRTFSTIEDGMTYAADIGFPEQILDRGTEPQHSCRRTWYTRAAPAGRSPWARG